MYYTPQYPAAPQQECALRPEYAPQYPYMLPQEPYLQQQWEYPVYPQHQNAFPQQNNAYAQYASAQQPMPYAPQFSPVTFAPRQATAPSAFTDWGTSAEKETYAWDVPAISLEEEQATATKPAKPDTKGKKVLRALSDIFFWLVCIALVAGSVVFAVSRDPRKDILGYRTYSVKTESMTPKPDGSSPSGGFRAGDMIIVKTTAPEEIKVGDIITFNPSSREEDYQLFLTHRVVGILNELGGKPGIYFVTKGDYNNSEDPPISSDMLIGKKVYSIPKIGAVLRMVQDNFALAITTILSFFACIFMFRWYFTVPKKPKQSV